MQNIETMTDVSVIWRGNKYVVAIASNASIKDLGDELQKLTGVKADTMKLIVPQFSGKTSKLLAPFSDEHSGLSLPEASIFEGKSVRMMGVSEDEVDKVLQSAKVDMRIAGFDEEEKRMKQRMSAGSPPLFKLPQGPYIFCDFQTLEIPGIELNPPASEALKRMHMLASDPGIVAIMNKHQWQVGIMTEMAPVGYVGVSPKCILGLNKNHGEEISLRLRTDDLKGFRKYETIKKTLLHELAHMVYSEHDANFYALDKQLNQEANSLDWTKSRGHTLGRVTRLDNFDEEFDVTDNISLSQKLGGNVSDQLENACASAVAAAYRRLANAPVNRPGESDVHEEPDPDDSGFNDQVKHDSTYAQKDSMTTDVPDKNKLKADNEADPDEHSCDPDKYEVDPAQDNHCQVMEILNPMVHPSKIADELGQKQDEVKKRNSEKFVEDAHLQFERMEEHVHLDKGFTEPDPDESYENKEVPDSDDSRANNPDQYLASSMLAKENPNEDLVSSQGISRMQIDEPDPDDQELQRIQDPVTFVCQKLQKAIDLLRAEVKTTEATAALQTLHMIISNVIEHPDEVKYKRLRKANPIIQRNVANHKAAMEILQMIGFSEDAVFNEFGKSETYLVLKRNDPGLLWLAKSSLEACVPC